MSQEIEQTAIKFIISVTVIHVVTYFIFGFMASSIFNYSELFELPIIKDYYKPFGSVSSYLGPLVQILRGFILGLVLLPFRKVIKESPYGWFFLWAIFVGMGILGTPSAAPSSIEGIVYSNLPLWFHLIGFPEILLQTLTFSLILHNKISDYKLIKTKKIEVAIKALSIACLSFMGYTLVSIGFALLYKANIEESGMDFKILAQFLLPLVLTFGVALIKNVNYLLLHGILYILSVLSLIGYQFVVLGSGNWVYALIAPILPVVIALILLKPKT